jgi:hypothetical protein
MAHAQRLDFVFQRKGPVHSNRRGCQLSQAVAGEVCTPWLLHGSNAGQAVILSLFIRWLPTPFASFPYTSPPVRHRVPSGFHSTIPTCIMYEVAHIDSCPTEKYEYLYLKVKFTLEQATKSQSGSTGIAILFLLPWH